MDRNLGRRLVKFPEKTPSPKKAYPTYADIWGGRFAYGDNLATIQGLNLS